MFVDSAGRHAPVGTGLAKEVTDDFWRLIDDDRFDLELCEHEYGPSGVAGAALCFVLSPEEHQNHMVLIKGDSEAWPVLQAFWPVCWDLEQFQPMERRASLLRAAALLLLEVTRLDVLAEWQRGASDLEALN